MTLIIDTDIGSDIDDAIALTYAVKSGIDIKLITTVHGPTTWRARLAKKLTQQLGAEIPVAIGCTAPIKQKQIFSSPLEESADYAHLGDALSVEKNGIEALAQTITDNKHDVTIAAIGPLTNLGTMFQPVSCIATLCCIWECGQIPMPCGQTLISLACLVGSPVSLRG